VTILTRYILREFFLVLSLALAAMIALFVVIDFFEKIDEFVIFKATAFQCLSYYFFKLPLVTFFMTPVAFLMATVITIGGLSRNNEITAMKSCGLSLMRLTGPILSASLIVSSVALLANEFIVPFTSRRANYIFHVQVRKERPRGISQRNGIWFRSNDGAIWQVGLYNARKQEMRHVSVFQYSGGQNLRERVDAKRVAWEKGRWIFYRGTIRTFTESGLGSSETFTRREIYYPVMPDDFIKIKRRKEEMTLRELYFVAREARQEGLDNTRDMVDFQRKISYPFISLITALIGIPFSLKSSRSGGVIFSIGLSIILGFSYYFIFSLGISLGYGGTLPPFLAAWGTNLLFTAMGLYLILTLDSETLLPSLSLQRRR